MLSTDDGRRAITNSFDEGCASSDAQPEVLGLLLSQMLTSRAFPEAANERDTVTAARAIEASPDVSDDVRGELPS